MQTINVQVKDGIAEVELNRPEARNAINLAMGRELGAALDSLAERDEVRAVIISGAGGKAFARGAAIAEVGEGAAREAVLAIKATLFQRLGELPAPRVHGV